MTDLKNLYKELELELENILPNKKIEHIKLRLSSISDPVEKEQFETFCDFLLSNVSLSPTSETIVVLIHGIRTYAIWQNQLKKKIEDSLGIKVIPLDYGYKDVVRFWLPIRKVRNTSVNHIAEELDIIKRDNPNANIVIIAHSFGTYIAGEFLKNNSCYQISRLLLCGSILPEKFKWDKLYNFKEDKLIVNEVGTKDFWPLLAKSLTFGYGASGTFGFRTHVAQDRYHNVDHSGFFNEDIYNRYWIPFIKDGTYHPSDTDIERDSPPAIATLSSLFTGQLLIIIIVLLSCTVYWLF
jgi:hypothetical protein